ncbi:MAG: metalloregulator ArsR/SmtB family transcription factor [Thiolinea sp.]
MQTLPFTKALSDETRMRILMLLMAQGELCVCDLTQVLDISQPKISRHLAILRESGLLHGRKAGLWVYYSFHADLPGWVKTVLDNLYLGSQQEAVFQQDLQRLKNTVITDNCC